MDITYKQTKNATEKQEYNIVLKPPFRTVVSHLYPWFPPAPILTIMAI